MPGNSSQSDAKLQTIVEIRFLIKTTLKNANLCYDRADILQALNLYEIAKSTCEMLGYLIRPDDFDTKIKVDCLTRIKECKMLPTSHTINAPLIAALKPVMRGSHPVFLLSEHKEKPLVCPAAANSGGTEQISTADIRKTYVKAAFLLGQIEKTLQHAAEILDSVKMGVTASSASDVKKIHSTSNCLSDQQLRAKAANEVFLGYKSYGATNFTQATLHFKKATEFLKKITKKSPDDQTNDEFSQISIEICEASLKEQISTPPKFQY